MQVNFEHLELLPKILNKLEFIEKHLQNNYSKRWLTVKELSQYIGYSKDRIYKFKDTELVQGYHYYKKSGKILFDSHAIDKWIIGDDEQAQLQQANIKQTIDSIVASVLKDNT